MERLDADLRERYIPWQLIDIEISIVSLYEGGVPVWALVCEFDVEAEYVWQLLELCNVLLRRDEVKGGSGVDRVESWYAAYVQPSIARSGNWVVQHGVLDHMMLETDEPLVLLREGFGMVRV